MKWYTDWWCITLVPENEQEKAILENLYDFLSDDAELSYEEGKVQWTDEVYAYPKRDPLPDTEGLMFTR